MKTVTQTRFPALMLPSMLLATFLLAESAQADAWPRFRGPAGQGISEVTNLPVQITAQHYRWKIQLPGGGQSSPVVWGDRIFLTCSTGEGRRALVCLDAANGEILWTYADQYELHRNHRDNSFVSSTPTVDADRIYLWWTDGDTYRAAAVDHRGKEVWRREMGAFTMKFGSGASPILAGDVVVVVNEHEADGGFVAGLDRATGTVTWKLPRRPGKDAYSTPAPRRAADGTLEVICTSTAHGVTALDPATGKERWSSPEGFTQRCNASPVFHGDLVFAFAGSGGSGKEAYALRPGEPPEVVYEPARDLPNVPTPVARDGRIYLWADRGQVSCLNTETGDVVWSEKVTGRTYTSPLWIGGRIYGIDREGQMVVLAAGDRFEELGRHQFEKGTDATPAVAHGLLYVRLDDLLICIGPEQREP